MKIYIAQTDGYEGTFIEMYTLSVLEQHRLDVTIDVRDADLVLVISNLDGTISSDVQAAVASALLDEIQVHDITGYGWNMGKSDDAFSALVTDLRRHLDAAGAVVSAGEREIAASVIKTHAALWVLDHVVPDVPPDIDDEIIDAEIERKP